MVRGRAFLGYATILAVGLGLAAFVRWQAIHDNERALAHYTEDSQAELTNVTRRVQDAMTSIYENLRTLTLLPSVRKIDRYGTQIGNDGRETIQQIYNNLANTVSVSEVYIVPVDLDPDAVDAATGNPEEPILMFDQLIVHGGMYADAANPFEATRAAGVSGDQVVVGASVGIAVAPADGNDSTQLLKNADVALYKAKNEGRATCRFFELAMDTHLQEGRRLELDLRRALSRDEFDLFYQPIVDAKTQRVGGFEALIRWHHPKRGLVMPGDFVPLAEETGLIVSIGQWVLERACADAAAWPGEIQVSVNLSPAQFVNDSLTNTVVAVLRNTGLKASRLQLEITESVLLTNNAATVAVLHQLRDLGVRIVLDDFGTGYSSLSYLRSFPFDKIKIDRSFIRDLAANDHCVAIVRAVASLGKSMGMITTAEGVETLEQIALVRELGCGEAQGYLFGKPHAVTSVSALLHERLAVVA